MAISMRRGRSVDREEGVLCGPRFVISDGVSAVTGPVICSSDLYCDGWDDRASGFRREWFE